MIAVCNISKKFKLYQSPSHRLKEIVLRRCYHKVFQALNDISFEVGEGETLGIVGQNGAGKSTLLKVLTGILIPDSGTVEVNGKITGLLELGTGFNPEFSGMENIFLNATYLGLSRGEIEERLERVIAFTELGDFIQEPIKTYSSGMIMRLAFSVAIHADPQAFVVDEALSVGDAYFEQKCMRKIKEFKDGGGAIIFVSHDMNAVKVLCDSAILLDHGLTIDYGTPKDIIDFYHGMILQKTHQGDIELKTNKIEHVKEKHMLFHESTTGEVELVDFQFKNNDGEFISYIVSENVLVINFKIKTARHLSDPHYGIMVRNSLGQSVFETNTYCMGIETDDVEIGKTIDIKFRLNCNLAPGDYSITVGVANKGYDRGNFEEYLLLIHDIGQIKVIENDSAIIYSGIYNMNPELILNTAD